MPTTILIVDDHAEMRQSLRDWVQLHFPACCIRAAASGEEAVILAQSEPPQLVIMDVGLPGINGFEAARQIRGKSSAVRIVMLSIHDAACYRAEAAAAGASAYVSKHQMHNDLLPAMRAFLTEPTHADGAATDRPDGDAPAASAEE
jgi:DNA-binding NarL/FixJ family response regulator